MIRVTKISIKNYRGLKAIETEVPGSGVIAQGRNGSGKTSFLNAIGAALAANDIGPDALKIDEKEGEILIDLDVAGKALHVRRRFSEKGSTISVENDDGDKKAKPTTLLGELLGSAPLDVISVVLETDKKKRRELILKALPVKASLEQLRRWVPRLPEDYDVSGHGLEVIERLRLSAYDKRTAANKAAKDAAEAAARAESLATANRRVVPKDAPAFDEAKAAAEKTTAALNAARSRMALAKTAEERTAGLRQQVTEWRAEAKNLQEAAAGAPTEAQATEARRDWETACQAVRDLTAQLTVAREREQEASRKIGTLDAAAERADAATKRAAELVAQADKTEAGIAAAADTITEDDVKAAELADSAAAQALLAAGQRAKAEEAETAYEAAKADHEAKKAEADRLDAVVKALQTEAPAAILAETPGVASGVEIEGDDVRYGGVSLDKLCGAEKTAFAAQIAKALNPRVGFLVVDGLERLDPEQLEAFVKEATKDGRQLFGSLVHKGDMVLAAIETVVDDAAAAE